MVGPRYGRWAVWLLLGVLLGADAAAQTTTTDRVRALERIVVGSNTFSTTSPLQVVGLPTGAGTACVAVDASGNVFQTAGACGQGTVTSVGLSMPGLFSVSNSPVTTSGTLGVTLASQSAALVFASPSGSSGTPTFRSLVKADLPSSVAHKDDANLFTAKQTVTLTTTPQVQVGYDAGTTFMTLAVSSAGAVTFDTHGTSAEFTFADPTTVSSTLTVGGNTTMTGDLALNGGDLTTASGHLTIAPAGDVVLAPGGFNVVPGTSSTTNVGGLAAKYLTGHFAELWASTLVAQDVLSTVGGSLLVTPTTTLIADLAAVSGASTMDVKHNVLALNDVVILQSAGKFEAIRIDSGPTPITGGFRYTVTRNHDSSGATVWAKGDAVALTGNGGGGGFLDLFSTRGVERSTCLETSCTGTYGPTIVGNWRTSTAWNGFAPRFAAGNLNGLYGYNSSMFGFAAGLYTDESITVDPTNGIRMMSNGTTRASLSGTTLTLGESGGARAEVSTSEVGLWTGDNYKRASFGATQVAMYAGNAAWPGILLDTTYGIRMLDTAGITRVQIGPGATATFSGDGSSVTNINGGNIQTGTITATKLLLRAGGAALTDDPDHIDSAAWVTAGGSCTLGVTSSGRVGTGVIGNAATTTECWMRSARPVAVDATKTYRVRGWMRNAGGGAATAYLAVLLFDAAGATISGDGVWWYYAAITTPSAEWTLHEGQFGAGTAKTIPSNARTMAVGVVLNYSTPSAWHQVQDARIDEVIPASLIVDGAITADKLAATAINGKTITGATFQTGGALDGVWDGKINGSDGLYIAGQNTTDGSDNTRAIRFVDDVSGSAVMYWSNSSNRFTIDVLSGSVSIGRTVSIGGGAGSSSGILWWGGGYPSPPAPGAHLYFESLGSHSGGISFRSTLATGFYGWDAFKPWQDGGERLGTAAKRWANIHLALPFGASTSLSYVVVSDPTDVTRLYAFTGGLDGTTTCGTGQSIYQVTVERGLVTSVGCR